MNEVPVEDDLDALWFVLDKPWASERRRKAAIESFRRIVAELKKHCDVGPVF